MDLKFARKPPPPINRTLLFAGLYVILDGVVKTIVDGVVWNGMVKLS